MPSKPIELPPEVAKTFVKRDEIAARQMHVLRKYQGSREKPVRIPDVIEMFREMKDQA
jgi:hypothetical protein